MSSFYVELAIGLVLAFFVLSLLASGLQEGLTRLVGLRAKFLWAYLRDQFEGGTASRTPASAKQMVGLVTGSDPRPTHSAAPSSAAAIGPAVPTADLLYQRLQDIDLKSWWGRSSISQIPSKRFAAAILEIIDAAGGGVGAGTVNAWLQQLAAAGSPMYRPLNSAWRLAEGNVQKFSVAVEDWFDSEMTRLSLLYRRHIRWVIGGLAVLITLFVGLDSVAYGRALMDDAAFRAQSVAVATGDPDKLEKLQAVCAAQKVAEGEKAPPAEGADPYQCMSDVLGNPAFGRILGDALLSVDLSTDQPTFTWNTGNWWRRLSDPAHWPGFLLTIVALMFGAPFWWDILRRLTGVRSSQSVTSRST